MSYTVYMNNDTAPHKQVMRPGVSNTDAIFDALLALGRDQWHSRKAVAAQLEKVRLNPYDKAALSLLVEYGRIEARPQPSPHTALIQRLEYRIVEKEGTNTKGVNAMGANTK